MKFEQIADIYDLTFKEREKAIKEYACAEKIRKYVHSKLGYEVAEEEMIYLTVHISRVIRRTENGDKAN